MVPCYGDCGPDDAWVARQAAGEKAAEREADKNKRENKVFRRMMEKGASPERAGQLQRVVDLEVDLDRLREERKMIVRVLRDIGKRAKTIQGLCARAESECDRLLADLDEIKE
jgi:hypothetical protein